ncbi:hypothetical protein [Aquisalinus flavus]|uniref:EF-hand domain-containing protein n=1 Tax=Aquisalinus flavus TaxID=1526572 RepID=A0A8J2V4A8_9PROT|nr:hypothetical protein [Aquisalinus flavus]MBD0427089.1 hypothetical protein [Aquisalinus flavus]UNE46912.1 hypothetical protein FF099_01995 [Aquisalinus flavus]GGC98289.1 hypothetical protein GCM10011342_04030 [Aquisalinus flavus]
MTKFMKYATAFTSASILSLTGAMGAAMAQEVQDGTALTTETEAAVEAQVETQAASETEVDGLTRDELTEITENQFAAADENADELLDEAEFETFTRGVSNTMVDDYAVNLDMSIASAGTRMGVDISSSGAVADMMERDTSDFYEDADSEDKVAAAASARFAELNTDGAVDATVLVSEGTTAFNQADADGDELLIDSELDAFAESFTGLDVSAEQEIETDTDAAG